MQESKAMGLAEAAWAALAGEEQKNGKLRASRLAGLGERELGEALWMAAGSRSPRRAKALFGAGAGDVVKFGLDARALRPGRSGNDSWEVTAFERAALWADFAFLEAGLEAGADPLAGWGGVFEGPWNFGAVGHDKQARWMARACAGGLSLEGAQTVAEWLEGAGAERASCSAEPGFCWDVADALDKALGQGGPLGPQSEHGQERARAIKALMAMVASWEGSMRARSKGGHRAKALARSLAEKPWEPADPEALWVSVALGPGPARALAACGAGEPPLWIPARALPWMRSRSAQAPWRDDKASWPKAFEQMPQSLPWAVVCAAWGSQDLAKAWAPSQRQALRSDQARECAAWLWAAELDPKGCAGLQGLGFGLKDLDGLAVERGWLSKPRLESLAGQQGLSPWALSSGEKALALGRLDASLWSEKALASLEAQDPERAALVKRKLLGACAKPAKRRGASRRL